MELYTVAQLATELGVSKTAVVKHIQQLGIEKDIARVGPQRIMALDYQQKKLISQSFVIRYDTPVSPEQFPEIARNKRNAIFTGQAAQQTLQKYIPNAVESRKVAEMGIANNKISITVSGEDGRNIWVVLRNTAHYKEPTSKHDTVLAIDGSTWYRMAQRYTKSAQQPQATE